MKKIMFTFIAIMSVFNLILLPSKGLPGKKMWRLRWAYFATSDLPESLPMAKMTERVQQRTKGAVKIDIYWSDSLVPIFEILDAVRTGAAEMGTWPIGAFSALDKRFAITEIPLLYKSFQGEIEAQKKAIAPFKQHM